MKTTLAFVAFIMVMGVAQLRAGDTKSALTISRENGSGKFVVTYLGAQTQDLKVTIKDQSGRVLISESLKAVKGFSLPVNLDGMGEGVYSVEVGNKSFTQVKSLDFTTPTPVRYAHVIAIGDNRYMLSVAQNGSEKIGIKILDDAGNAIYETQELIDGNFAQVYAVANSQGIPSFEVTDPAGRSLITR